MKSRYFARRALTLVVIGSILASALFLPLPVAAQAGPSNSYEKGVIVFDYSHGQHSTSVDFIDQQLEANLTAMGYTVVWALGGLNDSILQNAEGLVLGGIYGTGFADAEVTAVADWFNAGNKFLWVGGDSDYGGATYINDNASLVLEAVGSHVYMEPTAVEDPFSNAASPYRVVANTTSTNPYVAGIVAGVDAVLMHGPTCLYGSNGTAPAPDVQITDLEVDTIDNVYPLLYYGPSATIVDGDIVDPVAHNNGDEGSFVATTFEDNAGTDGSGVIVVSGASPYGDYRPMYADSYYGVTLNGYNLVKNAIDLGMMRAHGFDREGAIVIDYSHGQFSSSVESLDMRLGTALEFMGYQVVWAMGGINDTVLADAVGLVVGAIYGAENGFTDAEVTAVGSWFNAGHKFLWVGGDSDYGGATYINDNATLLLEATGSHVYLEPTAIEDPTYSCGSPYRTYTHFVGTDPLVVNVTENVQDILLHGPTALYGSNSSTPGADVNPVKLQDGAIENVYTLLRWGSTAVVVDGDIVDPITIDNGDNGPFVACSLEINAGEAGSGAIIVSGASPYGDYRPMYADTYYGVPLDGFNFVPQAIDFSIQYAIFEPAAAGMDLTLILAIGAIGAVVVIVIIVAVMKKK